MGPIHGYGGTLRRELSRDITEEELALELGISEDFEGNRLPEKELLELKDTLFGELKPQ